MTLGVSMLARMSAARRDGATAYQTRERRRRRQLGAGRGGWWVSCAADADARPVFIASMFPLATRRAGYIRCDARRGERRLGAVGNPQRLASLRTPPAMATATAVYSGGRGAAVAPGAGATTNGAGEALEPVGRRRQRPAGNAGSPGSGASMPRRSSMRTDSDNGRRP